jgi:hypothetical protein
MGEPSGKCGGCGLTFELESDGSVVAHVCNSVTLAAWAAEDRARARRSTLSPPPASVRVWARPYAPTDPQTALARVREALASEMTRTRIQAEALDDIERLVSNLERACVRHVSEARETGWKAGFAAGLDRAAAICEGSAYADDAARKIRELAKEF